MTKMNPRVKKLWVEALRSGAYEQGRFYLRSNDDKFCPLGVLCNLHAIEHPEIAAGNRVKTLYMGKETSLPPAVEHWAGVSTNTCIVINDLKLAIYAHNDRGTTFAKLAKAIEEQL